VRGDPSKFVVGMLLLALVAGRCGVTNKRDEDEIRDRVLAVIVVLVGALILALAIGDSVIRGGAP
jgi:uncharacterized membrane protein YdcZ (DUF606 family)